MSTNDDNSITVRPEDVLLASVAYSRPEMLALDNIIALHSQNKLVLDAAMNDKTTIQALPAEILLRVRAQLQTALVASLAEDAATALVDYESALVEGICPDCFWWNTDIYGEDLWAWVENGYRGACSCVVSGDVDPRTPSENKRRITAMFEDVEITTRGQWLRQYLARTYLGKKDTTAWQFARGVLDEFGCTHRFERKPSAIAAAAAAASAQADATLSGEPKKEAHRRNTSCDFGALVRVSQSAQRSSTEESAITLRRLIRELDLKAPAEDEPSIAIQNQSKY